MNNFNDQFDENINNINNVENNNNQANAQQAAAAAAAAAANEDNHWNPMEWDRAAEDLTWDRVRYTIFSLLKIK